jgi:hypothetical protein
VPVLLIVNPTAEAKLGARGISLEAVEQIRHNAHVIARNPHPRVPGARFLIGQTDGGEIFTLAIQPDAPDPVEWHVMTGWPATEAQTALFRRHV